MERPTDLVTVIGLEPDQVENPPMMLESLLDHPVFSRALGLFGMVSVWPVFACVGLAIRLTGDPTQPLLRRQPLTIIRWTRCSCSTRFAGSAASRSALARMPCRSS